MFRFGWMICLIFVSNVNLWSVTDAAEKHIRPDQMVYVIVGDVDKIDAGIRELNLGEIQYLDLAGQPLER